MMMWRNVHISADDKLVVKEVNFDRTQSRSPNTGNVRTNRCSDRQEDERG